MSFVHWQKSIGSVWTIRAVLVLGALGFLTTLGGYTCTAVNSDSTIVREQIAALVAQQVDKIKTDARVEMDKKLEELTFSSYHEESKAVQFTLQYPRGWELSHDDDLVRFQNTDNSEWFMVLRQRMGHPVAPDRVTSTEFFGYRARRLTDGSPKDGMPYEVLEIYPGAKHKDGDLTWEISGDSKNFQQLVDKITEFHFGEKK